MLGKFLLKAAANIGALWIAVSYIPGFSFAPSLGDGAPPSDGTIALPTALTLTLIIGGTALATLNAVLRPVLKLLGAILPLITFAMLSVACNALLLFSADLFLDQFAIARISSLAWSSLLLGVLNAIL